MSARGLIAVVGQFDLDLSVEYDIGFCFAHPDDLPVPDEVAFAPGCPGITSVNYNPPEFTDSGFMVAQSLNHGPGRYGAGMFYVNAGSMTNWVTSAAIWIPYSDDEHCQ